MGAGHKGAKVSTFYIGPVLFRFISFLLEDVQIMLAPVKAVA